MWAMRRSGFFIRRNALHLRVYQPFSTKTDVISTLVTQLGKLQFEQHMTVRNLLPKNYYIATGFGKFNTEMRTLSSTSNENDDKLGDGSLGREPLQESDAEREDTGFEENVEEVSLEKEFSIAESDDDVSGADDFSALDVVCKSQKEIKITEFSLFKVVVGATLPDLSSSVDSWVAGGNSLKRSEILLTVSRLCKCKMFGKALRFMEYMKAKKYLKYTECDYALGLDLVAKVRGITKAEKYIANIPKAFRGENVYRSLLKSYSFVGNIKKTEQIFKKMGDLGFSLTILSCNEMILLYKKLDRGKVANVLQMMEKENIKPSLSTYKHLIDIKGRSKDIIGMEEVVATMRADGVEPDLAANALIAKNYIDGDYHEKAESVLKVMEGTKLKENRRACYLLLPLYAALGKANDVARVWNVCEEYPRAIEYGTAIEAWSKVGDLGKAEEVFEKMQKRRKKVNPKYYATLLRVYADHKLFGKGEDLVRKMIETGSPLRPADYDALVNFYLEAGEGGKADAILQKATDKINVMPLYSSYIAVLNHYAKRGDIHNAEKIFENLRQAGYVGRAQPFHLLLKAYQKAKKPAYGFRERLKFDNVSPNQTLSAMLAQVDTLKPGMLDLLG